MTTDIYTGQVATEVFALMTISARAAHARLYGLAYVQARLPSKALVSQQ